jgi:hypothetical protein
MEYFLFILQLLSDFKMVFFEFFQFFPVEFLQFSIFLFILSLLFKHEPVILFFSPDVRECIRREVRYIRRDSEGMV